MKRKIPTFLLLCFAIDIAFSQGLSLPYSTGFDSTAEKAGWQQFRTGTLTNPPWAYTGFPNFSPPSSLIHDYPVGGSSTDTLIDWFVSPPLNFTTTGKLSLKVRISGFGSPLPESFELWFGTETPNPATGNFVKIATLSYMLPKDQWLDTTLNIPFISDSGYIALKYKIIGPNWFTVFVDNILVSIDSGTLISNIFPQQKNILIYPNPFSHKTTLTYSLFQNANVQMEIYNLLGEKIYSSTIKQPSTTINLDKPSGIYLYKLTAEDKILTSGKLIVQ